MRDVFENIRHAIWNLPTPIQRVCYVQLFAFMGWFPFLFYSYVSHLFDEKIAPLYSYPSVSTTYMGQIMAYELDREPDPELATRTGELAMLIYSVGQFGASFA